MLVWIDYLFSFGAVNGCGGVDRVRFWVIVLVIIAFVVVVFGYIMMLYFVVVLDVVVMLVWM